MTYGCKKPKKDIRNYKLRAGVTLLPIEFSLQHTKIKDQGNVNSCVAHATSSILEYYTKDQVKLSTNFIYGMERKVCGEEEPGMYLGDACQIVKEYGDMLEGDCPGNTEVPVCSDKVEDLISKSEHKLALARLFRIQSYYDCQTINDIKYAIKTYGPVLGCIFWYNDYRLLDNKGTIEFNKSSDGGYHAIVIYGWNQDGFLIQNSWGENFGKNGCFILPYEYPIEEAKVLIDLSNEEEINDTLYKPAGIVKCKFIYKPINFFLNLFNKKKKK